MQTVELQRSLRTIGFPIQIDGDYGPKTTQAVKALQYGYTPENLVLDGIVGPKTEFALRVVLWAHGGASANFKYREFACKHCGDIWVSRRLILALETYRTAFAPHGMGIVSGYRCKTHNRNIGGARNSEHIYGRAADVQPVARVDQIIRLRVFTGMEVRKATGTLVYHVDIRQDRTVDNPAVFNW